MLADTPSPHGSGATLASVGTLSEGFERSVASPLLPRGLRAMGCVVWSILRAKQSFLAALQVAACDGTHGLIRFTSFRQSFSTACSSQRSVHSKEAGREDSAPKSCLIAMPTPFFRRKAELGTPAIARACRGRRSL